jgi:hypothetical protein
VRGLGRAQGGGDHPQLSQARKPVLAKRPVRGAGERERELLPTALERDP